MRELTRDTQRLIDWPSPFVWLGIGMVLLVMMIVNQSWAGIPYLNLDAGELGVVFGALFAALVNGNHNRPQSKTHTIVFFIVLILFLSHGFWWRLLWEDLAVLFENRLSEIIPQTSYIQNLHIGQGGGAVGGFILISSFLCWPIWMLTHSRITRTSCLLAGPIAAYVYLGGGWGRAWHNYTPSLLERTINGIGHPMLWWYVIVFLPLAVLAQLSRMSTVEGICPKCKYSLAGLPEEAPCPECGRENSDLVKKFTDVE